MCVCMCVCACVCLYLPSCSIQDLSQVCVYVFASSPHHPHSQEDVQAHIEFW